MDATTIVAASPKQVSSNLAGEEVILNLESSMYYGLDSIGARIWALIQEPRTVGQIRDTILEEYDVDRARCEKAIVKLLSEMAKHGLVSVADAPSS